MWLRNPLDKPYPWHWTDHERNYAEFTAADGRIYSLDINSFNTVLYSNAMSGRRRSDNDPKTVFRVFATVMDIIKSYLLRPDATTVQLGGAGKRERLYKRLIKHAVPPGWEVESFKALGGTFWRLTPSTRRNPDDAIRQHQRSSFGEEAISCPNCYCYRCTESWYRRNPDFVEGEHVWVITHRGRVEPAIIKRLFSFSDGEERVDLRFEGRLGGLSASIKDIKKTQTEAEAYLRRKKKISKLWVEDIRRQEAEELLALHHDYEVYFFKGMDLWNEGYEYHQRVKALGANLGLLLESDEGHQEKRGELIVGMTVRVVFPSLRSMHEAKQQTRELKRKLNREIDGGWVTHEGPYIKSRVKHVADEDELEERYGHLIDDE